MQLFHVTVHAIAGLRPLDDPAQADWLWERLLAKFAEMLSATLMPQHLHLLGSWPSADVIPRQLGSLLSGHTRHMGRRRCWLECAVGEPLREPIKVRRAMRYVLLNPTRARLVDDPLKWPWSTHRGTMGGEHRPWVPWERVAGVVHERSPERWHRYVSADPSVGPEGSPPPRVAASSEVAAVPLERIVAAASAAVPHDPAVRRHLVVLLARDQGWRATDQLAAALGVGPRTVQRLAARHDPVLLRAGRICLADARFRCRPPGRLGDAAWTAPRAA